MRVRGGIVPACDQMQCVAQEFALVLAREAVPAEDDVEDAEDPLEAVENVGGGGAEEVGHVVQVAVIACHQVLQVQIGLNRTFIYGLNYSNYIYG